MTERTAKRERPESWNDWRVGTTGKLERLESWNDRKAGTTGELERPESWNGWRVGTTGKLERPESWNNWNDHNVCHTIGGTLPVAPIGNEKITISTNNKIFLSAASIHWCKMVSSTNKLVQYKE
jgi:hypothetical protein